MGLKKTFGIIILLMLVVMPMVFALDTEITVKTSPKNSVTLRVSNIDGSGTLKAPYPDGAFLDQIADSDGNVVITYSSEIINKFDISLMIGAQITFFNNEGEHIKAGWPIEIDATTYPPVLTKSGAPEGTVEETTTGNEIEVVVEIEEDTEEEIIEEPVIEENIEEIEPEISSGITGKAIAGVKDVATSKITYYVLGGIVLILIIVFVLKKGLLKKLLPKKKGSVEFGVKKDEDKKESLSTREELEDAEKKLDEAKKELEEVKGKDEKEERIRQIKARFDRDKAALEALEKE